MRWCVCALVCLCVGVCVRGLSLHRCSLGFEEAFIGGAESWANSVVRCFARLDCHVARYVLQKQGESVEVFTSLNDIALLFVRELRKEVPSASAEAFAGVLSVEEAPSTVKAVAKTQAQAKAKAESKATSSVTATHLPLHDLNSRGEIISGVGRLRALGFDLGSTVVLAPPLAGFEDDFIFVVVDVDDVVKLGGISDSERVATVPIVQFLTDAKQVSSGDRTIRHPGWPRARTMHTASVAKHCLEARVFFAVEVLAALVGTNIADLVDIFVKPSRQVRAKTDLAVGELRAIPEAIGVKTLLGVKPDHETPMICAEAFLGSELHASDRKILLVGSASSESVSPYWCFERTATPSQVNMVQVLYRIQLVGGADHCSETPMSIAARSLAAQTGALPKAAPSAAPDSLRRTVHALASRGTDDAGGLERYVYLPVLVNSVAVAAGTELKMEKPPASIAATKKPEAIAITQLAKKAKLG